MIFAYVLILCLCTSQLFGADAMTAQDFDGADSGVSSAAAHQPTPGSPVRPSKQAKLDDSDVPAPSTPTKTPTKPAAKLSPWKSPYSHKLTPGRPAAGELGSRVVVKTSPAELLRRRMELLAGTLASSSDSSFSSHLIFSLVPSVVIDEAIKQALRAECERYLRDHALLLTALEAKLASSPGVALQIDTLYAEERKFWDDALLAIDSRVLTKMPYRRFLGVVQDRQNGLESSPFFNGKNKGNVFDHAFSYEFLCRVLVSPETRAFKMPYQADLSPARDGSMVVSYDVIELHYPTELRYTKSPHSPVGGKPTDGEVEKDLGDRTSVIAFSQSPQALIAAYASAGLCDMPDGSKKLFIKNRFNWIFHAQHQKGIAPDLQPVQVGVVIKRDFSDRLSLELEIID